MSSPKTPTVADIMNPKLLYLREGDRLSLVRRQIVKFGVTAVPVLDDEHRPVGVISLRDINGADDAAVRVSAPVVTVRASQSVDAAASLLVETNHHHLVVVDDNGIAVGMVSALDLLRAATGVEPRHPQIFARF